MSRKSLILMAGVLSSPLFFSAQVMSAPNASNSSTSHAELIAKGKYLATLSDCYGCHTTRDGDPFAGGLGFDSPFGLMYSTNITPDKENGIGNYSYQDFYDAMHSGVAPKGNLYPAMPYTSYNKITEEDTKALYAYMMSVTPSSQKNKENDVSFPANIRFGLKGWNLFFNDQSPIPEDSSKSADWNRGNYILNSFGHCGECHTPRDTFFAMDESQHFKGAIIENLLAPDITAETLKANGWGTEDVKSLLNTGYSRKGTVVGNMYTAVYHSLSQFNDEDLHAATVYLLDSDQDVAGKPFVADSEQKDGDGHQIYMSHCMACHGAEGKGKPNFAPALAGNATLAQENINNTLTSIVFGIQPQFYSHITAFDDMPGFDKALNDQQLTDLIKYLKDHFTNDKSTITVDQVSKLRADLEKARKDAAH
ncbi:cytochrome c [Vibrio sp. SS-MA-C1-2]|uniref:cytochrome c n=1 Tax=Vibrio sp. SS-MA-C1-2 TaxID=2908646 RepID=UPI001F23A0F5|nr:cytochrome c [Vibrio sp. SS-MA-C1-2]UJF16847.1 cytochrome c [Vibrio sp. SS-MA-C1-2]